MDKKTTSILLIGGGVVALLSSVAVVSVVRKRTPNANVTRWDEYINAAALQTQIARPIIAAVIEVESSGNPDSRGTVGEIGLMQIKCETAKDMGYVWDCQRLYTPELNILYGAKYLAYQSRRYGGNLRLILSAYNAGTATSKNPTYVNRAMSAYQRYMPYYEFTSLETKLV